MRGSERSGGLASHLVCVIHMPLGLLFTFSFIVMNGVDAILPYANVVAGDLYVAKFTYFTFASTAAAPGLGKLEMDFRGSPLATVARETVQLTTLFRD